MTDRNLRVRRRHTSTPNPGRIGLGVDAQGLPVIDPTENVFALVDAAVMRLDNLLTAAVKRLDDLRMAEHNHLRELMEIRASHAREMREAEAARIDAIRLVDVGAVTRQAEVTAQVASTLAAQVASTAEAMRSAQIAAAASTRAELNAAVEPLRKEVDELRKAQWAAQGNRAQVVEARESRGETRLNYGTMFGAGALIISLIGLIVLIITTLGK